jgi:phage shock protein A
MGFVEYFLVRLLLWAGLLTALVVLAVGPRKLRLGVKRIWSIAFRKRLDPEEILTNVVLQHEQHVRAVRDALGKAEAAEAALRANLKQSEEHVPLLEAEAKKLAATGDELGARAALYKKQLEQSAIENFGQQLERHCGMIAESRQRLFMLELQLRQYEVGRSILLSQLAQAEKTEEQYAIARQFDPFNAVANWQQAEGLVLEKSLNARAKERVYADTTDMDVRYTSSPIDPEKLEAQLADLRAQTKRVNEAAHAPIEGTALPNEAAADVQANHTDTNQRNSEKQT